MDITVVKVGRAPRSPNRLSTTIVLEEDNWDDYGYKTMFQVYLFKGGRRTHVGAVKILRSGLEKSSEVVNLPSEVAALSQEYCSLGQALSYYETLKAHLADDELWQYLERMRDLGSQPSLVERFKDEPAFEVSLLREGGARRALEDARDLFDESNQGHRTEFSFSTNVGGSEFEVNFLFCDSESVPSRLNAVIGYNGVGKTMLLAKLAHVAWRDRAAREGSEHGTILPNSLAFGRVVAVSFSAFDTFEVPRRETAEGSRENSEYVYCGLRDLTTTPGAATLGGERLLAPEQLITQLDSALKRIQAAGRWDSLRVALEPLLREPSFNFASASIDFSRGGWKEIFRRLSTGHKISLTIILQLVAQLESRSLVLLDEPESHLHPPLLASLMRGVGIALDETNSYGVVATHSPVVLQEIAAKYVQVVRRYGEVTEVERPVSETFGENLGVLTRTVFNLDNTRSDFEGILLELGRSLGYEGSLALFPDGLSAQALSLVMQGENMQDSSVDD